MPVAIALAFSLVHGAFTGYFWEVIGIKPKHAHVKGNKRWKNRPRISSSCTL